MWCRKDLGFTFKSNYSEEKQFLFGLRDSKLKNDELLDVLYDNIIENYDYAGNFLIVVFHDAYDVMTKTSDNAKLDESEEVYEYLLCAICPVNLSKPALGYLTEENRIDARIRDWVVGAPDTGFVFPTFTDRTTDADNVMFYTKNAKEPHLEEIFEIAEMQNFSVVNFTEETAQYNAGNGVSADDWWKGRVLFDLGYEKFPFRYLPEMENYLKFEQLWYTADSEGWVEVTYCSNTYLVKRWEGGRAC